MTIKEKLEDKIHKTEKRLVELAIHRERLSNEHQELLKELALTSIELKDFAENSENFTPPIWEKLQAEKKQIDERLNLELNNINDPNKTKKTTSERATIQQHWLFVR